MYHLPTITEANPMAAKLAIAQMRIIRLSIDFNATGG